MKLAYFTATGRGNIDDLVAELVGAFTDDGLRLAGTMRVRPADPAGHPCDMELQVLPDGPAYCISQPLGPQASACRLDAGSIQAIALAVETRLQGADLLIVNKFGKLEAQGRGLCPAIAMATELGIPTLVGVNAVNVANFQAFSAGMAEPLRPETRVIRAWYQNASAPRAVAVVQ